MAYPLDSPKHIPWELHMAYLLETAHSNRAGIGQDYTSALSPSVRLTFVTR